MPWDSETLHQNPSPFARVVYAVRLSSLLGNFFSDERSRPDHVIEAQ